MHLELDHCWLQSRQTLIQPPNLLVILGKITVWNPSHCQFGKISGPQSHDHCASGIQCGSGGTLDNHICQKAMWHNIVCQWQTVPRVSLSSKWEGPCMAPRQNQRSPHQVDGSAWTPYPASSLEFKWAWCRQWWPQWCNKLNKIALHAGKTQTIFWFCCLQKLYGWWCFPPALCNNSHGPPISQLHSSADSRFPLAQGGFFIIAIVLMWSFPFHPPPC